LALSGILPVICGTAAVIGAWRGLIGFASAFGARVYILYSP